jgi:hypothetical protein
LRLGEGFAAFFAGDFAMLTAFFADLATAFFFTLFFAAASFLAGDFLAIVFLVAAVFFAGAFFVAGDGD